jgi:hypothetical protein
VRITYTKHKEDFLKYINIRNESILGHSIKPISKEKYDKIKDMNTVFIQSIISDIDNPLTQIYTRFHYKILEPNSKKKIYV